MLTAEADVKLTEREEGPLPLADAPTTASLYCLAAMVVDEAAGAGFDRFAKAIEAALGDFLATLPEDQQATALRLSFELAVSGLQESEVAAAPRIRLVYSR